MAAFSLCTSADGVEIMAMEAPSPNDLPAPDEGQQWVAIPSPIQENTVALIAGEIVPVPRVMSAALAFDLAMTGKRARINVWRAAFEYGSFTWDGSVFDSNRDSQARLMGLVSLAQMALATATPFEIDWTLADNTTRTLSAMDALGIGQALGAHVQTAHVTARGLKALVAAATTIEEVDAIAWPPA